MLAHTCNSRAYKAERGRSLGLTDQYCMTHTRLLLEKALCAQGMHWKLLSDLHMFTPMHICIHMDTTYRWTQIHTHGYEWTHTHTYECVCVCIPMHRTSYFAVQVQMNNEWTWDPGDWRRSSRDIKPASVLSADYSNSCPHVDSREPFLPLVLMSRDYC